MIFRDDEEHDFHYALENTRVVIQPQRTIETFGSSSFRFLLVSELLDQGMSSAVRGGRIEAERPASLPRSISASSSSTASGIPPGNTPTRWEKLSGVAQILRYGFELRKTDLEQKLVHDPMEVVVLGWRRICAVATTPMDPSSPASTMPGRSVSGSSPWTSSSAPPGAMSDEWKRRGLI